MGFFHCLSLVKMKLNISLPSVSFLLSPFFHSMVETRSLWGIQFIDTELNMHALKELLMCTKIIAGIAYVDIHRVQYSLKTANAASTF